MRAQKIVTFVLLVVGAALMSAPAIAQTATSCSMYANDGQGSDLGAKINNIIEQSHGRCQILIKVGTYDTSTTVNITTPGISLIGAGSALTVINYKGKGDFIRWQINPFTIEMAGTVSGMTINGTSAGASGIHLGDIVGPKIHDVTLAGFTGGSGLWQDNYVKWTERYVYTAVRLYNNLYGWRLSVEPNADASHGYGDVQLFFDIRAGQTGVQTDSGTYLYHSNIRIQGNSTHQIAAFIKVEPRARWNLNNYSIYGEGTEDTNGIMVAEGGLFSGAGVRNLAHMTDSTKSGFNTLETGLGGAVTTSGRKIEPGSCEEQTPIAVHGAEPSSTVTWAFSGKPPGSWQKGVSVMPAVAVGKVTIYLCNETSSAITPAPATLNLRIVN